LKSWVLDSRRADLSVSILTFRTAELISSGSRRRASAARTAALGLLAASGRHRPAHRPDTAAGCSDLDDASGWALRLLGWRNGRAPNVPLVTVIMEISRSSAVTYETTI
jgi:hypothetical protein